jgi:hypothetical protein
MKLIDGVASFMMHLSHNTMFKATYSGLSLLHIYQTNSILDLNLDKYVIF